MDLALWAAACANKADSASAEHFAAQPASSLAADYLAGRLPPAAQSAVANFLERYGVRGIAEIDLGGGEEQQPARERAKEHHVASRPT